MSYLLIVINVFVMVVAQTLWKIGMDNIHFEISFYGLIKFILSPYILGGGVLYMISTAMWFYILSKFKLSIAYPLQQGLTNVIMVMAAVFILKESITLTKVFAIALIGAGTVLLAMK
jgi:multidrug transporter EmrE-like cation transporter